jgi:hypothetical protein
MDHKLINVGSANIGGPFELGYNPLCQSYLQLDDICIVTHYLTYVKFFKKRTISLVNLFEFMYLF